MKLKNRAAQLLDFVRRGQNAQRAVDDVLLLQRIRTQLNRWAARYAATTHAKKDVDSTNQLISEIDDWLKNQPERVTGEQLAKIVRQRLRTLALDAPKEWRAVMEAEADALSHVIREFR